MKNIFLAIALMAAVPGFAQKPEVKGEQILADGKPYAQFEKDGCGAVSNGCQYYISSLSGKRLFVIKHKSFRDPGEVSASNPEGVVNYTEFIFSGSGQRAEVPYIGVLTIRPKDVAKAVVKARLLKDGELDMDAVQEFVANNGTPYTKRQEVLNQKTQNVIIIER